jgi:hypothetical protein
MADQQEAGIDIQAQRTNASGFSRADGLIPDDVTIEGHWGLKFIGFLTQLTVATLVLYVTTDPAYGFPKAFAYLFIAHLATTSILFNVVQLFETRVGWPWNWIKFLIALVSNPGLYIYSVGFYMGYIKTFYTKVLKRTQSFIPSLRLPPNMIPTVRERYEHYKFGQQWGSAMLEVITKFGPSHPLVLAVASVFYVGFWIVALVAGYVLTPIPETDLPASWKDLWSKVNSPRFGDVSSILFGPIATIATPYLVTISLACLIFQPVLASSAVIIGTVLAIRAISHIKNFRAHYFGDKKAYKAARSVDLSLAPGGS